MHFQNVRNTFVVIIAVLFLCTGIFAQSQGNLPDAPAPQQNVPPPPANTPEPTPDTPANAPLPGSTQPANQGQPENASEGQTQPGNVPPTPIETVPKGKAVNSPGSGSDELAYAIKVNVNFVPVPVTVKDDDGHLVPGLLKRDFAVFENGVEQNVTFFSSDGLTCTIWMSQSKGMP